LKLIIGEYEGAIYPEAHGYMGAIHIGTGADRQGLKRNRTNRHKIWVELRGFEPLTFCMPCRSRKSETVGMSRSESRSPAQTL
jgi:hypothetical protein